MNTLFKNNHRAFTLAEVLITVGIIGVIAAITIPALVNNYKKAQYVAQLKKTYFTFVNGFHFMATTEGVSYLSDTEFGRALNISSSSEPDAQTQINAINTHLSKYFKIIKACDGSTAANNCPMASIAYKKLNNEEIGNIFEVPYFQLSDGSVMGILTAGNGTILFDIDVNGQAGPNQIGRDAFYYGFTASDFMLDANGNEIRQPLRLGSYLQTILNKSYTDTIKESSPAFSCGEVGSANLNGVQGFFCLDRIIDEGWNMTY